MISEQQIVDKSFITKLQSKGFTRVPVFLGDDRNTILFILSVKSLLTAAANCTNQRKKLCQLDIMKNEPFFVNKDTHLLHMLSMFQEKKQSVCIVVDKDNNKDKPKSQNTQNLLLSRREFYHDQAKTSERILGIVHIKDIFEKIVDAELEDGEKHGPITELPGNALEMTDISKRPFMQEGREEEEFMPNNLNAKLLNK